jgi:uncharacterized protein
MCAQAVIDSLEFARTGQTLRDRLPVKSLARLQDHLFDSEGDVDFRLSGGRDEEGRLVLRLAANGLLHLRCQRCLGRLEFPLALSNTLLLLGEGEDPVHYAEDPEAPDFIDADPQLDVAALVEDEILLSLPIAPRHESDCASGTMPRRETSPSAFAQLEALRNRISKH